MQNHVFLSGNVNGDNHGPGGASKKDSGGDAAQQRLGAVVQALEESPGENALENRSTDVSPAQRGDQLQDHSRTPSSARTTPTPRPPRPPSSTLNKVDHSDHSPTALIGGTTTISTEVDEAQRGSRSPDAHELEAAFEAAVEGKSDKTALTTADELKQALERAKVWKLRDGKTADGLFDGADANASGGVDMAEFRALGQKLGERGGQREQALQNGRRAEAQERAEDEVGGRNLVGFVDCVHNSAASGCGNCRRQMFVEWTIVGKCK